jgi:hypothetical protein
MTVPGLINVDFADVRTIMNGMGRALMGAGVGSGKRRATEAAEMAISSPLLEDVSIQGATGILINITGGPDLTLHEVNEASSLIQNAAHEDANIIFGSVIDPNLSDEVRITVIATGFDRAGKTVAAEPQPSSPTPVRHRSSQDAFYDNARGDHLRVSRHHRAAGPQGLGDSGPGRGSRTLTSTCLTDGEMSAVGPVRVYTTCLRPSCRGAWPWLGACPVMRSTRSAAAGAALPSLDGIPGDEENELDADLHPPSQRVAELTAHAWPAC